MTLMTNDTHDTPQHFFFNNSYNFIPILLGSLGFF